VFKRYCSLEAGEAIAEHLEKLWSNNYDLYTINNNLVELNL